MQSSKEYHGTSLVAQTVKHLSTTWETRVRSLGREVPWRRKWQSTPVLLPGKSHGQRSLVGYSPWGHKQLNMTERLHFHFHFLLYSGKAKEAEGSLFPTNKKWGTWKGFAPWPQRSCSISMRLFYFSVWDLCYSCPMLTKDQQNKYYLI